MVSVSCWMSWPIRISPMKHVLKFPDFFLFWVLCWLHYGIPFFLTPFSWTWNPWRNYCRSGHGIGNNMVTELGSSANLWRRRYTRLRGSHLDNLREIYFLCNTKVPALHNTSGNPENRRTIFNGNIQEWIESRSLSGQGFPCLRAAFRQLGIVHHLYEQAP
jgi:hypothetical protein